MPTPVTLSLGIQYTPPSAPTNSGSATLSVQSQYNAQNVGQIDIQTTDLSGATFVVPFGSVASGKVVSIKNMMSSDIGVRMNGAISDNFRIPSGGVFVYAAPTAPTLTPLSSMTVVTTATPTQVENVHFWVFGD
jgi:hypothetical protein